MKKSNPLLRAVIVVSAGLLLASISLLFIDRYRVPAKAQAQELFTLYFEMDHLRQDSAQLFAELMKVTTDPGRVGAEETIGSNPSLSSQEELSSRLKENQTSVEQTLEIINANKFTDPEVNLRYDAVRAFYTSLFEFEEMVLRELSIFEKSQDHARLVNNLFEGTTWPALLGQDAQLRDALTSLANLHGLEFAQESYEDLFRERLVELDTPIISDDVNTIVYPFTVSGTATHYVLLNVTFDIPLSDKIKISIENPHGKIISSDQLAEYTDLNNSAELNHLSYISRSDSVIIVKLFPEDALVTPIPGDWKLYVTAPVGSNMVIGMIEL